MKIVIDRFEGDIAVVEIDGETFDLPKKLFPANAAAGDAIKIAIKVDKAKTDKLRKEIEDLMDEVWED